MKVQLSTSFAADNPIPTLPAALNQHYKNICASLDYFISEYNTLAGNFEDLQQLRGDVVELQLKDARIQTLENIVSSKDKEIEQLQKIIAQLRQG